MSAMTLLPCPFCGNTNDFEGSPWPKDQPDSQNAWFARCGNPNCGAEVVGHTPEEAAALWNTRTTLTQPRAVPDGWSITPEPNPMGGKNAMCLRDPSGRSALFGTFSEEVVVRDFLAALLAAAPSPGESNSKPADCSGDPSSCPDNEGHGCYCSDIRRAGESA